MKDAIPSIHFTHTLASFFSRAHASGKAGAAGISLSLARALIHLNSHGVCGAGGSFDVSAGGAEEPTKPAGMYFSGRSAPPDPPHSLDR